MALATTWAIWVVNAMDIAFILVLSPSIVSEFGISGTTLGTLIGATILVRVFFDLPIASWSDRIGSGWRRKILWAPIIVLYALASTASALRGVSSSVLVLFGLRAAVNAGSVACETISVSATSEWWPKRYRGFAVGLHHTGYPIGTFLAGQVAAFVLIAFGNENWRYAFWFSLLSLPLVGLYWWLSTPGKFERVYERISENGLERPHGEEESVSAGVPWWHVLKQREIVLASVYSAFSVAAYFMFATAFPLYLAFVGGYSFAQVASFAVVWALTAAVFQFLLPALSDKVGRKPILVGAGFYAGAVLLLLPYATSALMVFLVQIMYGVVLSAIYPLCFSVCSDAAPPGRVATSVSISTTLLWGAAAVAVFFTGRIIDLGGGMDSEGGYLTVFYLMSALSFAAGAMYLFARETAADAVPLRQLVGSALGRAGSGAQVPDPKTEESA
jgi:MFS family permease